MSPGHACARSALISNKSTADHGATKTQMSLSRSIVCKPQDKPRFNKDKERSALTSAGGAAVLVSNSLLLLLLIVMV